MFRGRRNNEGADENLDQETASAMEKLDITLASRIRQEFNTANQATIEKLVGVIKSAVHSSLKDIMRGRTTIQSVIDSEFARIHARLKKK